jgi:DNA-binding MarR family transcriptional regulator
MVLLTRLAKQVYRRSNEQLLGMHQRHLMALSYVRDHDAGPQQELAEALCMDANNVVLLLNELEELGWVNRQRDPQDRRRHLVNLTPKGQRELAAAESAQESIEADVLRGLEPAERAILRELLARALREAEPVDVADPVVVAKAPAAGQAQSPSARRRADPLVHRAQ